MATNGGKRAWAVMTPVLPSGHHAQADPVKAAMNSQDVPSSDEESIDSAIDAALRESFEQSERNVILRRRAHRLLEQCCTCLQAFLGSLERKAQMHVCKAHLEHAYRWHAAAVPTLKFVLGLPFEKQYRDQFHGMWSGITGPQEHVSARVISGYAPFAPGKITHSAWKKLLDLFGERWAELASTEIRVLERLILEIVPELPPAKKRLRKRTGRPQRYDPKEDQRIYEAWNAGHYRTFEGLAKELGRTRSEVKLAIDRHRHRKAPE